MKSIISTFLCFCGSIPLELGISGRGLLDTKNQRLEQTAILLDLLDDDYGTIFDPGNCFIKQPGCIHLSVQRVWSIVYGPLSEVHRLWFIVYG